MKLFQRRGNNGLDQHGCWKGNEKQLYSACFKKEKPTEFLNRLSEKKDRNQGDFKFSTLIISKESIEGIGYQKIMSEILIKFNLKNSPDI